MQVQVDTYVYSCHQWDCTSKLCVIYTFYANLPPPPPPPPQLLVVYVDNLKDFECIYVSTHAFRLAIIIIFRLTYYIDCCFFLSSRQVATNGSKVKVTLSTTETTSDLLEMSEIKEQLSSSSAYIVRVDEVGKGEPITVQCMVYI